VPDRAAARQLLAEVVVPGDVVLVKASRSYGLEVLAADLLDAGAGA
jgi:UDP-N-acetylmuramoyl-tripeptide--D-alanyl-D-alanine ligase